MDFEIGLSAKFQSFATSVSASGLNKFVVLTGRNGAGKTQLLKLLSGTHYMSPTPEGTTTIKIYGEQISPRDIVHIVDFNMPGAPPAGVNEITSVSQQAVAVVNQMLNNQINVSNNYPIFSTTQLTELQTLADQFRAEGYNGTTYLVAIDEIVPLLSSDFDNHTAEIVNERIGRIIYRAHMAALREKRDVPEDEDPIYIFNELCAEFEMPFHLAPFGDIFYPYVPVLNDEEGNKVEWSQLSAGEMVLFRIITWVFYYKMNNSLAPKLFLLDEPDAHLTPKMIRKFIDSLQDVLVNQMGIAVLMTTHSPNTVALTEEATLYELQKNSGGHSIHKISKKDALQTFSEGLLFVQEKTKMVFLEGKADPPFYGKLYEIAVTKHNLTNTPPLNFIAVSEDDPDEGGCTKVVAMVRKFNDTIISDLVHGVIDRDRSNSPSQNVRVLSRYSIENYLYDPLVIVVAFIRNGRHKTILQSIQHVDTNDIEFVLTDPALLQSAIDEVLTHVKAHVTGSSDETAIVCRVFTKYGERPIAYNLPQWFIDIKKSALMTGSLRKEQGQPLKPVTENEQLLALESAAIVHEDILLLLEDLAS